MKVVLNNGRNGLARHNDRDFNLEKSDGHIDITRQDQNIYHNCYDDKNMTFDQTERKYYKEHYSGWMKTINKDHIRSRHKERTLNVSKLLKSRLYCPEETIIQIGSKNNHVNPKLFEECVKEYVDYLTKYDKNVHVLDWAIHNDEATPHVHIRKVYDYIDENGDRRISQNKALEALNLDLPNPEAEISRANNRKMTLDMECRERLYEICEEHGIEVDRLRESLQVHLSKQELTIQTNDNIIQQMLAEKAQVEEELNKKKKELIKAQQDIEAIKEYLKEEEQQYKDTHNSHETRKMLRHTHAKDEIDALNKENREH